jgi:hypothetical protein
VGIVVTVKGMHMHRCLGPWLSLRWRLWILSGE